MTTVTSTETITITETDGTVIEVSGPRGPQGPTGADGAAADVSALLVKASNLSDLTSASSARTNLGLGTMATATATDYLTKAGNLAGLADLPTARTNLGLGTAAVADTGTGAGTVAAGDDSRLTLRDVAMVIAGSTATLSMPDGITVTLSDASRTVVQPQSVVVAGTTTQSANDELAPVSWTRAGLTDWSGGNHACAWTWTQAAGSLTAADIGKQWESGANRITLLAVSGANAVWSPIHNVGTTVGQASAPTGTWTLAANPSVTFSAPTQGGQIFLRAETDTGIVWESGSLPMQHRQVVQDIVAWDAYVRAVQVAGAPVAMSAVSPSMRLTSDWRWPGDQPGVTLVDVELETFEAVTVTQWSGLQMARASGSLPEQAVVGVTPGHALETWVAGIASNTYANTADWADGIPPSVCVTRHTTRGGVACGIFASTYNRSLLTSSVVVSNVGKSYPIAIGGAVSLASGVVHKVRGWRSISPEASNRHVHVARDLLTGITTVAVMAGSTGLAWHPALRSLVGQRIVQDQGTATLTPTVLDAGIAITGAGWATAHIADGNADDAVRKSVLKTKGDLFVGTGTDVTRLPAPGNDVSQLSGDSAATLGVTWRQSRPTIPVGNYFPSGPYTGNLGMPTTQGQHLFFLINIGHPQTISEISLYAGGAAAAGALWRIGLWSMHSNGYGIGNLIADGGTVDPTTTGKKTVSGLSAACPSNLIWGSLGLQGSGGGGGSVFAGPAIPLSWTASLGGGYQGNLCVNSVSGALPGTVTPAFPGYSVVPVFEFKRSA